MEGDEIQDFEKNVSTIYSSDKGIGRKYYRIL